MRVLGLALILLTLIGVSLADRQGPSETPPEITPSPVRWLPPPIPELEDEPVGSHVVSLASNLHVRGAPRIGANGVGRIRSSLTIHPLIGQVESSEPVSINGALSQLPWYQVQLASGTRGYVYGAFVHLSPSRASAQRFVTGNKRFRARYVHARPYCLAPLLVAHDSCDEELLWRGSQDGWKRTGVRLQADGTLRYVQQVFETDQTFTSLVGSGRYFVFPERSQLELQITIWGRNRGGYEPTGTHLTPCRGCGIESPLVITIPLAELDQRLHPTSWSSGLFTKARGSLR